MKKDRDSRPHVPTSPEECDPNAKTVQRWQPKRLSFKEGSAQASWVNRVVYLAIVIGTAAINGWYLTRLPESVNILTWFGYASAQVPTVFYAVVSFCLICYLVYRDIVNRSLSRRKLFIPLIFFLGNYYLLAGMLAA